MKFYLFFNRTAFYMAVEECNIEIIKILLSKIETNINEKYVLIPS